MPDYIDVSPSGIDTYDYGPSYARQMPAYGAQASGGSSSSGLGDMLLGGGLGLIGSGIGALFNIGQQDKMMRWQERMSNTQYQRAVADMRAAGLNPMMMYGGRGGAAPMGSAQQVSMGNPLESLSDAFKQTGRLSALELSQLELNRRSTEAGIMQAKASADLASAQAVKIAGPDTDVANQTAKMLYEQTAVEHIRQDVERWRARALQQGISIQSLDEQLGAAAGRGIAAWFPKASDEDKRRLMDQIIAGATLGGRAVTGAVGAAKGLAPYLAP